MSGISHLGYVRELIWGIGPIDKPRGREFGREGYAPLYSSFEGFYTRNIFRRYKPVVGQVITTVPGARLRILQHSSDDYFWTSRPLENSELDCVNLGSYNYLGYAENSGPCTDSAIGAITKEGLTSSSSRHELGKMQKIFSI
jgi:serine palmitoyltransferase